MTLYWFVLALIATIGGMAALCVIVLIADTIRTVFLDWRDRRAAVRREADQAKWNMGFAPIRPARGPR